MSEVFPGVDITRISRIRDILSSKHGDRFLRKTYTDPEITYCESKSNPAIHFAGRFAAKEAVKKCLMSSNAMENISLRDIEILSSESGAPGVTIHTNLPWKFSCRVSISHDGEYAIAYAIFTQEQ